MLIPPVKHNIRHQRSTVSSERQKPQQVETSTIDSNENIMNSLTRSLTSDLYKKNKLNSRKLRRKLQRRKRRRQRIERRRIRRKQRRRNRRMRGQAPVQDNNRRVNRPKDVATNSEHSDKRKKRKELRRQKRRERRKFRNSERMREQSIPNSNTPFDPAALICKFFMWKLYIYCIGN